MSGKYVYVGEEYHAKLKVISAVEGRDMKDVIEEQIQQMEVPSFEDSDSNQITKPDQ